MLDFKLPYKLMKNLGIFKTLFQSIASTPFLTLLNTSNKEQKNQDYISSINGDNHLFFEKLICLLVIYYFALSA